MVDRPKLFAQYERYFAKRLGRTVKVSERGSRVMAKVDRTNSRPFKSATELFDWLIKQ